MKTNSNYPEPTNREINQAVRAAKTHVCALFANHTTAVRIFGARTTRGVREVKTIEGWRRVTEQTHIYEI